MRKKAYSKSFRLCARADVAKIRGLLLSNLGTPASPAPGDVRLFLREFLSDPYVLDMSPLARWFLLNCVILPFRPRKSSAAYEKVWTEKGSPILIHGRSLARELVAYLGEEWVVGLGMRYGQPSMENALKGLVDAGADEVIFLPLYPQYALSSSATSIAHFKRLAEQIEGMPPYRIVQDFYDSPVFCEPSARLAAESLPESVDHVLFSFHGLPVHQVQKTDPTGSYCHQQEDCCAQLCEANRLCYRAQSHQTAKRIAQSLGLSPNQWSLAFQSRLTKVPWIEPHTDKVLVELANSGVRHLAVMCPSFVADCLETLEEIDIRGREDFLAAGGEAFTFVPCLNARPDWVRSLAEWVQEMPGAD
jgi:protoporphyrin/coproporphyrin ferrochelatase